MRIWLCHLMSPLRILSQAHHQIDCWKAYALALMFRYRMRKSWGTITTYRNDKTNDILFVVHGNNIWVAVTGISICDQYKNFSCILRSSWCWVFKKVFPEKGKKNTVIKLLELQVHLMLYCFILGRNLQDELKRFICVRKAMHMWLLFE